MPEKAGTVKATILVGHVLDCLKEMPECSVQCVVTSPPYWGLRDYGIPPSIWGGQPDCLHDFRCETLATERGKGNWAQGTNGRGELQPGGVDAKREPIRAKAEIGFCSLCGAWQGPFGLEPTPELYIQHAVTIFREICRVLRKDGTLWLNIGDSYAAQRGETYMPAETLGGGLSGRMQGGERVNRDRHDGYSPSRNASAIGLKRKDLVGIPWMLAFALRADGWWLRQDIIWSKPNPMPESVTDRCTKAHEYLFLFSKSPRYYFDNGDARMRTKAGLVDYAVKQRKLAQEGSGTKNNESFDAAMAIMPEKRNKRSVWTIATQPYS